ncbi:MULTISPECIES: SDR family oxidoreductase [Gammaproteobacteria]|uniref:SDR family oxidoreductase n=1 Tax=Gammaproteobacteria TaxID=1236 RepID=UPI000DD0472D|nr:MULTISPECIES: SDR family oxidoreductase [Gammaproteobacteria]RTE86603.1 SDR family oxidoreductase [Aliidiomarina sp. B3213]TCZ90842.1 SDR family oxidoreductase [Lysobacter sp. N42]
MGRLANKVIAITGAARGIGAGVAKAFHDEGATVILTDILEDECQALANELGKQAYAYRLDVRNETEWQKFTRWIEKQFGKLNGLFNNAGITGFEDGVGPHDPEHATLEEWHKVHAVNLDGTFLGCKYAIQLMRKTQSSGSIINMSSRSGLVGIPRAAAYASSKAAIRNHTKSVALYCAQENLPIRCNSIHPAAIMTPIWEPMLGEGEQREKNIQNIVADCPMKRFGEVSEVAAVCVLLASDEANYMNASELTIDGGILAGSFQPIGD